MVKGKSAKFRKSMSEQVEQDENKEYQEGEQMPLIDIEPENAREIIKQAKIYEAVKKERIIALQNEVESKHKLLELIKNSGIPRSEDGSITYKSGTLTITVTPRDELVKVKDKSDDEITDD
jgi:hypothetical protein